MCKMLVHNSWEKILTMILTPKCACDSRPVATGDLICPFGKMPTCLPASVGRALSKQTWVAFTWWSRKRVSRPTGTLTGCRKTITSYHNTQCRRHQSAILHEYMLATCAHNGRPIPFPVRTWFRPWYLLNFKYSAWMTGILRSLCAHQEQLWTVPLCSCNASPLVFYWVRSCIVNKLYCSSIWQSHIKPNCTPHSVTWISWGTAGLTVRFVCFCQAWTRGSYIFVT